jgi:poly-gamma-glutamate synthesis protein (capsule biosynthesis protein)
LKSKDIGICGEGYKIIKEIKGKKFGFLGYMGWNFTEDLKSKFISNVKELRSAGVEVIIPYFHWGSESEYKPNNEQVQLARFAIDNGADAVIGSHPHVMQTIESYKGKLIAYSMGNFCFGGNSNPPDKKTFILQIKTNFQDSKLVNLEYKVIPTMISSKSDINDYVPTVAVEHKNEILQKLNDLSPSLNGKIGDEFFILE